MTEQVKRSQLPGELGASVERALAPDAEIVHELKTYRGYGLVLTRDHLILVVGGVLAGLKAHEQHVHRLEIDDIQGVELDLDKMGCLTLAGPPLLKMTVLHVNPAGIDPLWDTLIVEFKVMGAAIHMIGHLHEQIGRRQLLAEQRATTAGTDILTHAD